MYGRLFKNCFTGSMYGAGPTVFAVWSYVIANTCDGHVEINPKMLAAIIGTTVEDIDGAIKVLTEPDPFSRNRDHDGARLVHQDAFMYLVPSWHHYNSLRAAEERAEYQREWVKVKRASKKASVDSRQTATGDEFDRFWAVYPRKAAKLAARKAFLARRCSEIIDKVIEAVEAQKSSDQWTKDGGQFIPFPATWLNQGRWDDQVQNASTSTSSNLSPDAILAAQLAKAQEGQEDAP